jgi:probable addiction module antidote protein
MPVKVTDWDTAEILTTPSRVASYLEAVFEDGEANEIKHALGVVARAKGMTKIAKATGLTREALYKALKADGDPKFSTFLAVMRALDMRLVAKPAKSGTKTSKSMRKRPSPSEAKALDAKPKAPTRKKAA